MVLTINITKSVLDQASNLPRLAPRVKKRRFSYWPPDYEYRFRGAQYEKSRAKNKTASRVNGPPCTKAAKFFRRTAFCRGGLSASPRRTAGESSIMENTSTPLIRAPEQHAPRHQPHPNPCQHVRFPFRFTLKWLLAGIPFSVPDGKSGGTRGANSSGIWDHRLYISCRQIYIRLTKLNDPVCQPLSLVAARVYYVYVIA